MALDENNNPEGSVPMASIHPEAPGINHDGRDGQDQENFQVFHHMLNRLLPRVVDQNERFMRVHTDFLASRHASLAQLGQLTGQQIAEEVFRVTGVAPAPSSFSGYAQFGASSSQVSSGLRTSSTIPLFDRHQLEQFATGSITSCLGPAYAVYGSRRTPRIPNGELLLMSRITRISGNRRDFSLPASITAEFDVPANPWFYPSGAAGDIPYAILMEIALQPCGFLSAYLETPLVHPEEDYYFRNLDGRTVLLERVDLRGKTVVTQANLLRTTVSAGIIIQAFAYDLLVDGVRFFQGQATFGYFPAAAMASQVGLDGGKLTRPWMLERSSGSSQQSGNGPQMFEVGRGNLVGTTQPPLDSLDAFNAISDGGQFNLGYCYARKDILPEEWYFQCHFFEDPVMPGSLGIESMLRALREYAIRVYSFDSNKSFAWVHSVNIPLTWRYRGQIRPNQKGMELELHISKKSPRGASPTLCGDASLWIDGVRIYEVSSLSITLPEGAR